MISLPSPRNNLLMSGRDSSRPARPSLRAQGMMNHAPPRSPILLVNVHHYVPTEPNHLPSNIAAGWQSVMNHAPTEPKHLLSNIEYYRFFINGQFTSGSQSNTLV